MEKTHKTERAKYWLQQDQWTLFEAVCLIDNGGFAPEDRNQEEFSHMKLYDAPLFQSALRSIKAGKLDILNKLPEDKLYNAVLLPMTFLKWLSEKKDLPAVIRENLSAEQQAMLADTDSSALKNINQRHRERSRALAEYLWQQEPALTIEDMIHHDAINGIACENRTYAAKTLREWLKDLCPNRQPGRRPVQKSA